MLVFAVTLHNMPEGMAVGVAFAGFASGYKAISFAGAISLSIGIAIQNFPEASEGEHSNIGTIGFEIGFIVMMALDVALG